MSTLEIIAIVLALGVIVAAYAYTRWPVATVVAAESAVTRLEPYIAPIQQYVATVHPARAFDDWIENEAKNAAAIMKAKMLADYHAAQNLAAHQAAFAPAAIPLQPPAPVAPVPPPTPPAPAAPNVEPGSPS